MPKVSPSRREKFRPELVKLGHGKVPKASYRRRNLTRAQKVSYLRWLSRREGEFIRLSANGRYIAKQDFSGIKKGQPLPAWLTKIYTPQILPTLPKSNEIPADIWVALKEFHDARVKAARYAAQKDIDGLSAIRAADGLPRLTKKHAGEILDKYMAWVTPWNPRWWGFGQNTVVQGVLWFLNERRGIYKTYGINEDKLDLAERLLLDHPYVLNVTYILFPTKRRGKRWKEIQIGLTEGMSGSAPIEIEAITMALYELQ